MNVEKLRRLQSQVRIGGKGTARRKKKVMHQTATTDDKKLQSSLKKLSVSTIPGIEEVNIIKDDLTVIHFNNPKAQASLSANTFAVTGHGETKKIVEMLPEILPQLGQETVVQLRMFANTMADAKKPQGTMGSGEAIASTNMLYSVVEEDDVPMLVSDFDEVAKMEAMKVGEAKTSKNELPAIECEQTKKSDEDKGETAAVLPPLTEVKSNEKGNAAQPLDILNLNIKSNEESELQKDNENLIKKQEIIPEKEKIKKVEKQNIKNDVGKTKEKPQQKQETSKQKVKPESKPQKSSKDNKKSDDFAPKASTLKAVEKREVEGTVKDGVVNDIVDIELEKSEQVTKISTNLKDNKEHLQTKQVQQKQQQKTAKQEPKKKDKQRGPLVDNQEKNTEQNLITQRKEESIKDTGDEEIKKQDELQQIKTPDPIGGDGQQVTIGTNQQQQQNNESTIKQRSKQPQQKQQKQDNQNKPDAGKGFKSSETTNQDNKQQIKTSKEGSADKTVDIKKKSNETQSQDIKRNLKEVSPNEKKAGTETKSSQMVKEALKDKIDTEQKTAEPLPKSAKQDDKKLQKSDAVAKDNKEEIALKAQSEEVGRQKEGNVQIENSNKDNVSTIESGKQVEADKASENVSIKTVALQSLESSEKMLQIVNEITKDLMIENVSKLSEETLKQGPTPNLPSNQQETATIAVQSELTEELLPKSSVEETQQSKVNKENQKPPGSLSDTSTEIVQDFASNAESLNKESDGKSVIIKEQLPSVANEIVADIKLSMDKILPKVSENNDKSLTVGEQISQEQILPSQDVSTLEGNLSDEQLAKQSLPAAIPQSSVQIPANIEVNNHKFIAANPAQKQPTMAEILQSPPPTIPPTAVLSLSNKPIVGQLKDIQLLNKEDVKELQVDSTVAVDGANSCQPQDQGAIIPELSTSWADNISEQRQLSEEKSTPTPKQKASPPKQTTNAKTSNETTKQQTKPSTTADSQKGTGDSKLKLVTKPQTGQQYQQQQSKAKSKPTNCNKSTPTTSTTPTKMSPEKGTTDKQKPTISATKTAPETSAKKANSPQKQQQTDTSAKPKPTPGASGKPARPNTGTTSSSAKKANTPPATNKTNANTGVKQADISKKGTASGTPIVAEQHSALAETKSPPATGTTTTTPPTSSPAIEDTATSNKPSSSK